MKRKSLLLIALGLTAVWAAGVSAAPVTLKYAGFENGSRSGGIYGARNVRAAAGQFSFDVVDDGGVYWDSTLNAFCIDVSQNLVTGQTAIYDLVSAGSSSALDTEQVSLIGQLFDSEADSLGTATNDAAFQLALWEIVYDFDTGALDLLADNFYADAFSGARALAQGWLSGLTANLNYVSSKYELYTLSPISPAANQTLLTWRPVSVPEPAPLSLLGAGLLLIGAAVRRRNSRR